MSKQEGSSLGTIPTIRVKSEDHGGEIVTINEGDFDPNIHERVEAPKRHRARLTPPADSLTGGGGE